MMCGDPVHNSLPPAASDSIPIDPLAPLGNYRKFFCHETPRKRSYNFWRFGDRCGAVVIPDLHEFDIFLGQIRSLRRTASRTIFRQRVP